MADQYHQGDRVEYRNAQDQTTQGTVQDVQGTGQSARYTIRNTANNQLEDVTYSQVLRRL